MPDAPHRLLVENALRIDPEAGEAHEGASLLCEGERILEIQDDGRRIDAGTDVQRIDARGKALLPGLIDAHVHATITTMNFGALERKPLTLVAHEARGVLEGMLGRGFTTVRDAAGADRGLAKAIEDGWIRGPRLHYSGRALSQTGGHGDFRPLEDAPELCACRVRSSGIAHVADGVDAVRLAAREELRKGASQVKLMASGGVASPSDPIWNVQYSEEEMRAIVEEAAGWRRYAMAHAYSAEAVSRAVRCGVRSIEHGNLIDAATARLMKEHGAFLVPTLVTYFKLEELGRELGFPEVSLGKLRDVLDQGLRSLELAREAGVPMGYGTDLLGETHRFQNEEFRIRAEALPAVEVLRAATTVNAHLLQREGEIGVLAPGACADFLLVDGNPLEDVTLLAEPEKRIALVAKGGRVALERGL